MEFDSVGDFEEGFVVSVIGIGWGEYLYELGESQLQVLNVALEGFTDAWRWEVDVTVELVESPGETSA